MEVSTKSENFKEEAAYQFVKLATKVLAKDQKLFVSP